jgi:hypothetical protein
VPSVKENPMKKKPIKTLTLNRETLLHLRAEQLIHPAGGQQVVISDLADNFGVGFCAGGPRSGPC